ncbi:MAG: PLD nuclease N-terminal domain-containing protein [Candidatus Nealsonbacteria bacterium]|nr:PLD nuclease N-terminal domain-containing protein [Candidatus Nealsonbacteria bacterium]
MLKINKFKIILLIFILGLTISNTVLAQIKETCTVNGKEVSCDEMNSFLSDGAKGFLALGLGFFIVSLTVGLISFIFWLMMLIHAIKKPIESKPVWIILMIFTGIFGAIIYYFAVKRGFDKKVSPISQV